MSEFHIISTSAPPPPSVPTSFQTDSGTSVPLANIEIFHGYDSQENNPFGITVKGGTSAGNPPGSGVSNEVDYYLTNRLHGSVNTTVAPSTATLITFNTPLTVGCYKLTIEIAARNVTTVTSGAGYLLEGTVVANGLGNLLTVGTPVRIMNGDATVFDVNLVDVIISGANIHVDVTGVAGNSINWVGVLKFVFAG